MASQEISSSKPHHSHEGAFSGLVLAGGQSSRMGSPKAHLAVGGQLLITRQCQLLAAAGASEILVSIAHPSSNNGFRSDLAELTDRQLRVRCRIVEDHTPDSGPMGGLLSGWKTSENRWMLVVPVDLPMLTSQFLREMLALRTSHAGIIPESNHGIEPLLACYPRTTEILMQRAESNGQRSVQRVAREAIDQGMLSRWVVPEPLRPQLLNWNQPGDWNPAFLKINP